MRLIVQQLIEKNEAQYGLEYANLGGDKYSTTIIAKKIRNEIKELIKTKLKKLKLKVSVRKRHHSAIDIEIQDCYYKIINTDFDRNNFHSGCNQTEFANLVIQLLKAISNKYNYDNSEPMTDYFDVNFYCHPGYDYDLKRKQEELFKVEFDGNKYISIGKGIDIKNISEKPIIKKEVKRPNLNKVVESLEKQINNISISYDCNITRRRAEQLRQNQDKQDLLKNFQIKAKRLDEMWKNGTISNNLKHISTKSDIELLSHPYNDYPTLKMIENAYEWLKKEYTKRKLKFDKWGLDSQEKMEEARIELNELKVELSPEEVKQRKIKQIEDDIRGVKIPGFFPTPANLIEEMIELGDIKDCHEVLEPSAGKGDMVDVLKDNGIHNIDCIEINHSLKSILEAKDCKLVGSDFLEFNDKKYDRIIMNPPFENLQDIDHVRHAYSTLKEGGVLVSVMGAAPFFRNGVKSEEFRTWIDSLGAEYHKNDDGAFKNAFNSTGVSTYMITIKKVGGDY